MCNCFYGDFGILGHFRKFHSYGEVFGKHEKKIIWLFFHLHHVSHCSCLSKTIKLFFRILAYGKVLA